MYVVCGWFWLSSCWDTMLAADVQLCSAAR